MVTYAAEPEGGCGEVGEPGGGPVGARLPQAVRQETTGAMALEQADLYHVQMVVWTGESAEICRAVAPDGKIVALKRLRDSSE